MAIGDVGAEFLGHGVVLVRIKGFTFGLDFLEAVVFQKIFDAFLASLTKSLRKDILLHLRRSLLEYLERLV